MVNGFSSRKKRWFLPVLIGCLAMVCLTFWLGYWDDRLRWARPVEAQWGHRSMGAGAETDACAACHVFHTSIAFEEKGRIVVGSWSLSIPWVERRPISAVVQARGDGWSSLRSYLLWANNAWIKGKEGEEELLQDPGWDVDELCFTCHEGMGAPTSSSSAHGRMGEEGSGESFVVHCADCHDVHGTENAQVIRPWVRFRWKGRRIEVGPILFLGKTGKASFDDGESPPNTRLCVACHEAVGTLQHSGGADHVGRFDFSGEDCTVCHPHSLDNDPRTVDGFLTVPNARALLLERARVDLQVTYQVEPAEPVAGRPFTLKALVENRGPQDAWEALLRLEVPSGFEVKETWVVDGAPCQMEGVPTSGEETNPSGAGQAQGVLVCPIGDIPYQTRAAVSVVMVPEPSLAGETELVVEAEAVQTDPAPENNQTTARFIVVRQADLVVTHVAAPDEAVADEEVTYTLKVVNQGPSWATGVTLEDTLPQEAELVAVEATQGACTESQGAVTCVLGTLAVLDEAQVHLRVRMPRTNGRVVNRAEVRAQDADPDPASNVSETHTWVRWHADVQVTQEATPSPAAPGDTVTLRVQVVNQGPLTAEDVTLSQVLSPGLQVTNLEASQGTCQNSVPERVVCDLGVLPPEEIAVVTLTLQAPDEEGEIVSQVEVQTWTVDPNPDDNRSELRVPVYTGADLTLEWQAPASFTPGTRATYTLRVTNRGPEGARGVVVEHPLPNGMAWVGASGGTCTLAAGTLRCDLGDLSPRAYQDLTFVMDVRPDARGQALLEARVSAAEPADPNEDNNQEVATAPLTPRADVSLEQQPVEDGAWQPGMTEFPYRVVVRNLGPSTATQVVLVQELPDLLVPVDLESDPPEAGAACAWTQDEDDRDGDDNTEEYWLECVWDAMAPDTAIDLVFRVQFRQSVQPVTLMMDVSLVEPDPEPDNNHLEILWTPATPTPTPSPTPTPMPTWTPTPTPTPTWTPMPTPTPTPTLTPTPEPLATPTPPPSLQPTATPTPTTTSTAVRLPEEALGALGLAAAFLGLGTARRKRL